MAVTDPSHLHSLNSIKIGDEHYFNTPKFVIVNSGYGASNDSNGVLSACWINPKGLPENGNYFNDFHENAGQNIILQFNFNYRGFVNDFYIQGESASDITYNGYTVRYLDIPDHTALSLVYDNGWHVISLPNIMCITYSKLKKLRDDGYLIPGMKYRIIDYLPYYDNTDNLGLLSIPTIRHTQFDLVVTALSTDKLSEDANALPSLLDSDAVAYYENNGVDVTKWRIKYTIDCDPGKYNWAKGYYFLDYYTGRKRYIGTNTYRFGTSGDFMGFDESCMPIYINNGHAGPLSIYVDYMESMHAQKVSGSTIKLPDGSTYNVYNSLIYNINGSEYYASNNMFVCGGEDMVFIPATFSTTSVGNTIDVIYSYYTECNYDPVKPLIWDDTSCGVIYELIDNYNNNCCFDFKNIMLYPENGVCYHCFSISNADASVVLKRCESNTIKPCKYIESGYSDTMYHTRTFYKIPKNYIKVDYADYKKNYEFDIVISNNYFGYESFNNKIETASSYTVITDNIFNDGSYNNLMKGTYIRSNTIGVKSYQNTITGDYNTLGYLNCSNTIYGSYNTLGTFQSNTKVGQNAISSYNSFGNGCANITMNNSSYNSFGNYCRTITIDNSTGGNSFGNGCSGITIGISSYGNSFGNYCSSITIGSSSSYNSFGNYCSYITTGTNWYYNSFGNNVMYCYVKANSTSSSANRNFVRNCHWDDGVKYVYMYNGTTANLSAYVQNVKVARGCNKSSPTMAYVPTQNQYEYVVQDAPPQSVTI